MVTQPIGHCLQLHNCLKVLKIVSVGEGMFRREIFRSLNSVTEHARNPRLNSAPSAWTLDSDFRNVAADFVSRRGLAPFQWS